MSNWRDVNRNAWTFTRRSVIGAGGGFGDYLTAYAIKVGDGLILNGRIAADIRLVDEYEAGAGLICRADELSNFLALYLAPSSANAVSTVLRLGAFRQGVLVPIAVSSEPVLLEGGSAHFSFEFYSGMVRGEVRSGGAIHRISAMAPHLPFAGYVGVMKLYSAEVVITNVTVEQTQVRFAVTPNEQAAQFPFDVFLCHSGQDKELVSQVAKELRDAGVLYWLDSEQIQFGASITQKIEDGLQKSRYVVPCLSENLVKSGWTRAEYGAVLNAEFGGQSPRVVIPLKLSDTLADSDIPLLLRDKKRVLYSNKTEFLQFIGFLRMR